MEIFSIAALSLVVSAALAQQQYRPGGGFGGGSGGFGAGAEGGFDDGAAGGGGDSTGSLEENIPGIPGDDYPIFAEVPETSFLCDGQVEGGYYADPEAECQVFHICGNDGNGGLTKYSFLCPNGTIFQQQYFVCDWWFNVDCSLAEDLYSLNDQYAAEREANSGAGASDGDGVELARGQSSQQGQGSRGGQTGGRGGQEGGRGGARGSSAQSGGRPGSRPGGRRNPQSQGGGRRGGSQAGSQPGYLAPAPEESLGADTGYGAPLGQAGEGAGDFPPLSQYTRNTRDSQYAEQEEEIMEREA